MNYDIDPESLRLIQEEHDAIPYQSQATYPTEATYPHEPLRFQYFEREFGHSYPDWWRLRQFEEALRREGRTPGFF